MSDSTTSPSRYAIIRFHKYKSGSVIQKVKDHNIRAEGKQPDGVDPSRSHLNLIEGAQTNQEFDDAVKARMATLTRKPRPDANRLCQAVVTGSPAVFKDLTREQSIELLRHGVELVSSKVGRENIVRVSFHFDEETPHAHIDFVPVVTRERVTKHKRDMVTTLDAQRLLGGPVELEQWWTDWADLLKSKGYDVERATTAAERMEKGIKRPKHKTARQWWGQRLKEAETVMDAACTEFSKQQRFGQQMATTMLQKAKQRTEAIHAAAQEQAQKNETEARRLHEEKQRLEEWADQLKMSAEKIAKNTGHLVTIEVPAAPRPDLAPKATVPGANAPGSPGRTAWVPSATPSPFDKPPGF